MGNLEKLAEEIKSYEYKILGFSRSDPTKDFINSDPVEEGYYLTIRLGLNGIYTSVNYWKDGSWAAFCLDGSRVVARTRNILNLTNYEE